MAAEFRLFDEWASDNEMEVREAAFVFFQDSAVFEAAVDLPQALRQFADLSA